MNKTLLGLVGLVVAGGAALLIWNGSDEDDLMTPTVNTMMHGAAAAAPATPANQIVVAKLSSAGQMGQIAFGKVKAVQPIQGALLGCRGQSF